MLNLTSNLNTAPPNYLIWDSCSRLTISPLATRATYTIRNMALYMRFLAFYYKDNKLEYISLESDTEI